MLGRCYQSGDWSSTDLIVEEAVGCAGTRGAETQLHMMIYTHGNKSQICILTNIDVIS